MATTKKKSTNEETKPKVQNAFEAFLSARKKPEETHKEQPQKVTEKKSLRDERITKVCATCGKEYHPTRNGYSQVSKYCSQKCAMNTLRGKFTLN